MRNARLDEPVVLREALACVFEVNGAPGHPLVKSLPHWTRLPQGSPLDVDSIAALIGSAHRRFLSSDGLRGEHPDATLASLWRLARDPIEECRRQQQRALEDWRPVTKALLAGEKETAAGLMEELESRQELRELPDDDAYRRWAQFASEPAYVENVRSHFEGAWENLEEIEVRGHMGHTGHGRRPAGPLPRIERAAPVIGGWASRSLGAMDSASMTLLWALYQPGHTSEWWGRLRPDGAELMKTINGREFMSLRFRSGDDLMAFAAQERQDHLSDGWLDVTSAVIS